MAWDTNWLPSEITPDYVGKILLLRDRQCVASVEVLRQASCRNPWSQVSGRGWQQLRDLFVNE